MKTMFMANSSDFFPSSRKTRANAQIKVSLLVNSIKLSELLDSCSKSHEPLILSLKSSYKSSIYSSSLLISASSPTLISESGLSIIIFFILSENAVWGLLTEKSLRFLRYCNKVVNSWSLDGGINSHFCIISIANRLTSVDSFKLFSLILI